MPTEYDNSATEYLEKEAVAVLGPVLLTAIYMAQMHSTTQAANVIRRNLRRGDRGLAGKNLARIGAQMVPWAAGAGLMQVPGKLSRYSQLMNALGKTRWVRHLGKVPGMSRAGRVVGGVAPAAAWTGLDSIDSLTRMRESADTPLEREWQTRLRNKWTPALLRRNLALRREAVVLMQNEDTKPSLRTRLGEVLGMSTITKDGSGGAWGKVLAGQFSPIQLSRSAEQRQRAAAFAASVALPEDIRKQLSQNLEYAAELTPEWQKVLEYDYNAARLYQQPIVAAEARALAAERHTKSCAA